MVSVKTKGIIVAALFAWFAMCVQGQSDNDWQGDRLPGQQQSLGDFTYQKNKKMKEGGALAKSKGYSYPATRPSHVNNALLKYFPPVFSQDQGSCGVASFVGYQYTYERNNYYQQDASLDQNKFATHFFFWQNNNSDLLLRETGAMTAEDFGGQTYSRFFTYQSFPSVKAGWIQGYNKWRRIYNNRNWGIGYIEEDLMTEAGREMLKNWLWNHDGDYDFPAGGIAGITIASTSSFSTIPSTATNRAIGVAGKYYLADWGPTVNHAQTVVGYDDRIEFDLDGNGIYGEKDKDEVGAWIVVNSWGDGWGNNGFVYCPYARAYMSSARDRTWPVERQYIRKDYEPLRMLKVKMSYSHRSMLWLSVTATQDTASDVAQDSMVLYRFNYCGDNYRNATEPPAVPMLGQWADGMRYEPMEFGYDITPITANFDRRKPIKYFFNIYTREGVDEANCGTGRLYNASVIDYEFSDQGVEFPFKIENPLITGSGKLYRVSVVVPGEKVNPPTDLQLQDNLLAWQSPEPCSLPLSKYYIYHDGALADSVAAGETTYQPASTLDNSAYSVAAVYSYNDRQIVSDQTARILMFPAQADSGNIVLDMHHTMAVADDIDFIPTDGATMEYWICPRELKDKSDMIGNPQGLYAAFSNGKTIYANQKNCTGTTETAGKWRHVAIVLQGNRTEIYSDGKMRGGWSDYQNGAVAPFSTFYIGRDYMNGLIDGKVDEIRLWNRALTREEIAANNHSEVARPTEQKNLILYYKGDTFEKDGHLYLRDHASAHHALIQDPDSISQEVNTTLLSNKISNVRLSIASEDSTVYTLNPTRFSANLPISIQTVDWTVDGDSATRKSAFSPVFTFQSEGSHTFSLTATDINGQTYTAQRTFDVKALPAPVANFDITKNNLPASESFSFVNRSIATNATYTWKMPGADVERVQATNASARFLQVGSYPVTLVVSNAAGTDSITKEITAVASAPYVEFGVSPSAILLGDKVFFQDKSNYDPTSWQWEVNHVSGKRNYAIIAQNTAFTPVAPGYYNVTLRAGNAQGTTSQTQKKVFAVSNADPGNGLQMTGSGERFALSSPFTSATRAFTIDTWLYPSDFNGALTMSTDDGGFKTKSNSDGSVSITVNGKTTKSDAGYLVQDEWHHYAITFSTGNVKFYRDAELFSAPSLRLGLNCPAWAGSLTVSSDTARFKGMIDEFRIWSKALTQSQLQSYCNQPIATDDIESAKTSHGLKVYYQFNQNSGDIVDASGNGYTATILDLPAVDPWTSALGVFTLDFGGDEPSDVSEQYLTNYKAPFLDNGESVSTTNSTNLLGLKTGTEDSKWVVENTVQTEKSTTGAHVYKTLNSDLNFRTGYYGFADTLKNHLLYQTTHLPAGYYTLSVSPSEGGAWKADSSMLCVVKGDEFVDMSNYETKSDAYTSLANGSITFSVGAEQDVTIGLIVNLEGWNAIDISEFKLMRTPMTEVEPDDETSVYSAVENGSMQRYTPVANGIRVINETLRPMKVYTVDGRLVFNEMVEGVHFIPFQPGIYIIDGQKIQVK